MRERETSGTDWARVGLKVSGPLATLATVVMFDILTRRGMAVPTPFVLLLVPVIWAASRGGVRPGILSAVFVMLYSLHYYSLPDSPLTYAPADAARAVAVLVAAPAAAILVGLLRQRELERAEQREPAAATDAAPALPFPVPLDEPIPGASVEAIAAAAAAQVIPALGDWCAVHLVDDAGRLRCVATAHRDPACEPLVHELQQLGPHAPDGRVTPAGVWGGPAPVLLDATEPTLAMLADGPEELRLYRALAPARILTVSLAARGRSIGVLEIGAASPETLTAATVPVAARHAARITHAVDAIRLAALAEEAERRYRLLFESHPNPMWIFDAESLAFLDVNDAAIRYYGYNRDEFLRLTIMDVIPEEEEPALLRAPERRATRRDEVAIARHQKKDGSIIDVEIVSHALVFAGLPARLALVTDVSDRARARVALRQSEEQLRKAQKLDAVGRLAGGVAHDFNNILTAIHGYSDLLLREADLAERHRQDLEEIRRAADRGAQLTRQLLTFGRRQSLRPAPVDLNAVVRALESLLQRLLGADIQLETVLAPDLGSVRMDAGQVEQVIINLALNARDAMADGGTLTIETGERQLAATSRGRSTAKPGRYVMLTVTDTGAGMDSETQAHLFEPFYTTKQSLGSGLGLAIVHGIVKGSGGAIRVSSETDAGTAVRIYLPRIEASAEPPAEEPASSVRGLETILLVEDEEAVRAVLRKVLATNGYAVLEARHGRDALLVAERHRGPIHLLLTDVVMPEMGGRELSERLAAYRPETQVLFISGYTSDEVLRKGGDGAEASFVQKPFKSDDLLRRVRALLDADASARRLPVPGAAREA